jgi:hypothetical protein
MSKLEVLPKHKFKPIIIEGENYEFSKIDRRNVTYIRDKLNPQTNQEFRDVLVYNHGTPQYYLGYRLRNVPSLTYKAYWVAVNDNVNSSTSNFKQLLGIGTPTSAFLPYTTVIIGNYSEVPLGQFTMPNYNATLNVYLTADNTTTANTNMIIVDYIRLEPVL